MRVPNVERAVVTKDKILGYLLSPTHRSGAPKHAFFTAFGFTQEGWQVFAAALRRHAAEHDAVREESAFGQRFRVDGPLATPDGRNPRVRTVWFIETGAVAPRLVTAYPAPRES